jgi:uncharacterized membrane protein YbhN (UPF0104 family)
VSPALATIVVEKVLDLLTLGLILAGLVVFQQLPELPGWMQASVVFSAWALVGGLVGLVVVLALRRQVIALVGFVERRVPILGRIGAAVLVASFLEGLSVLAQPRRLPAIVFWSVAIWTSAGFTMWSGLAGVGISASSPAVLLALVVTNLGMAVPSAPGYVGVFHQLLIESLLPYGVDRNHAAGAAIVMHALVFGNFILGGIWCLWRGGHSMGSLRDASGH